MARWRGFNSAHDLKALRALAGLSQAGLARLANTHKDTVTYWEAKPGRIDGHAPQRFRQVFEGFGLRVPTEGHPPVVVPIETLDPLPDAVAH